MDSWFPVAQLQIENEAFKALTPTEKLYFWQVLSELNLSGGQFYKSDIWFAAVLKLSIDKIRKARAKLAKLGFIDMTPGTQDKRGRKIATKYIGVRWQSIPEGERFMQMDRPTLERLIDYIRSGRFTHEDIVCFVYASYLVWIKGGLYAEVTKSEFLAFTDIGNSIKCLESLYAKFKFDSGATLFDLTVGYRTIRIENIRSVAFTQERWQWRIQEIDKLINVMRDQEGAKAKAKARQEGDVYAEDLLPLFKELYIKHHGKSPTIGNNQYEQKLSALGDPAQVAKAIESFFDSELPAGLKNYSIYNFIKYAEYYMY